MTTTSTELITLDQVEEVLLHGGDIAVVSSDDIQADIVSRVLGSETVEEAFQSFETTKARELEGVAITIHGVAWARSAFEEGPKVYALLDVTRDGADEHEVVSMGGRSLMASLVWACRNEAMPVKGALRLRQSNANPERRFYEFNLAPKSARK